MFIKQETIDKVKTSLHYDKNHYYSNIARYIIRAYNNNESSKVMNFHLHKVFGVQRKLCGDLIKAVMKNEQ